jgi:NADH:ubiquinone oxidoreductase subunit 5 (subunit L)/multisubunit Na+/H+ antiporter MnhA subunit
MAHDPAPARYFAYLNLFVGAMLMLVLADNLVLLFVGWEGVGLCSYLLIGFWYEDPDEGPGGAQGLHRQPHRRLRVHPRGVRLHRACSAR